MKRSFLKIVSLFLIIGLNYSGIFAVGKTAAHFNDIEASPNNLFSATKLDFSLGFFMSDGFRTQTQGGWGSVAKGDNPGVYRDENFDDAFPNGLTIGNIDFDNALCMSTIGNVGDYYAHFESSEAIEDFLPAKGTPAIFSHFYDDNPLDTEAGILAGQVVALTLNVGFDNYDPNFSVNEGKLADFYANEVGSLCEEMTAGEVLAEANLVLSGGSSEFSPSEINECVTEINERFVDGERAEITPSKSIWRSIVIEKYDGLNFQHTIEIEQVSEDPDLCVNLKVDAYLNGELVYFGDLLNLFNESIVFSELSNSWKLDISLDEDAPSALNNKSCEFKYIILGWQEDIEDGGFFDVEEIFDFVESGEWEFDGEELLGVCGGPVLLDSDLDTSDDTDDTDAEDDEDADDMKEEGGDDVGDEDDTEKDDDADVEGSGASEDDDEASDENEDDVDEGDEAEDGGDTDAKDEENVLDSEEKNLPDDDDDDLDDENDDGDGSAEGSTQDDEASDGDDNTDADTGDMKEEDDSDDTDADDMKEEDSDDAEDESSDEDDGNDDTDTDDMKEEDSNNDADANDIKEEDNDDVDANGSTALRDNGASDDDEDDGNDNTEGSAQDDGAQDGLNKNMVDSVQASV